MAALISVLVAGHLWWIHRNRTTLAVDLDEGQLLVRSDTLRAATGGGPSALWHAWTARQPSAPALGVATAVSTSVFGRSPRAFLLPELVALVVLLLAVWWIARQLGAGRWALLAVAVVGVSPGVVQFTRVHHQIVPGAAALALCVAVGLRTDALRDRRWSLVLGVAVGIALLTRAMLVVSAPLAIAAWAVALLGSRPIVRQQLINALIAAGLAMALALTWWAFVAGEVIRYLFEGARGNGSARSSRLSLTEVRLSGRVLAGVEDHSVAWACVAVLAVGMALCLVRALARRGPHLDLRELYVLVVAAVTFVGLVASQDDFPGYSLLVVPIVVSWAVARAARESRAFRWIILGPVVGLTAVGLVTFPTVASSGVHISGAWILSERPNDTVGRSWADTYQWVIDTSAGLGDPGCPTSLVVVQVDHRVTVGQLQWAADVVAPQRGVRAVSTATKATPASVRVGIAEANDNRSLLVLVDPTEEDEFAPLPAAALAREARRQGYRPAAKRTMPNGAVVSLWAPAGEPRRCS